VRAVPQLCGFNPSIFQSYTSLKIITRWWEQCGSHFRVANFLIKLWPVSQQTFHIFFSRMLRSKRVNGVANHNGKRPLGQNGKDDRKIHKVHAPRTKPPIKDQSALVAAAATLVTWQTYSVKCLVTLTSRLSRYISTRGPTWPKIYVTVIPKMTLTTNYHKRLLANRSRSALHTQASLPGLNSYGP
jgi:hypothetical protein